MPDYASLPDSEINRLCAERCGWTTIREGHDLYGMKNGTVQKVPDYCRDRNALVELWDAMTEEEWSLWKWEISKLVGVDDAKVQIGLLATMRQAVTATPRQHCEAFLKATEGVR